MLRARNLVRGPAAQTGAVFAALFMAIGAHMPFWPIWLSDWGLSEAEIGLYLGLGMALRVGTGVLAPWLADLTGRRRTAVVLLAGASFVAFAAHPLADGRGLLLALTLVSVLGLSGCVPLTDALAAAASRRHGFAYAPTRAAGSAAFLLANLGCGWAVAIWGSDAARWWILVSLAALAAFALRHPGGVRGQDARPRLADVGRLLRAPAFRHAALASAALQAAHAPLYAYGSLDWRTQGIGGEAIGALWAVSVAAEIALMLLAGGWLARRLGPAGLFAMAGLAGLVRWSAMLAAPSLDVLWGLQMLHAFTFAAAHLGLIGFVAAAAPTTLTASAQGLIGAGAGGLAMALGTFGAAALHGPLGSGIHALGIALSLVGLVAARKLAQGWHGGEL